MVTGLNIFMRASVENHYINQTECQ